MCGRQRESSGMKAGDACWEGSGRYFLQIAQVQQQVTAWRVEAPKQTNDP